VASELADGSDAIATRLEAGDPCGALSAAESLQQRTVAAINAGRVPARYQEELTGAVNALAASIRCPAGPPTSLESPAEEDEEEDEDDEDESKGKGKAKGKGKGKRG